MKLKQVLINLLSNAVKFTPAPGSASLTVERTPRADHHWALRFIVKDTGNAYNLILVDLRMPGQDGVAVTRKIRNIIGNETAVILLTAYDWPDVEDAAREAGVDSFLRKPLFASTVLQEFRQAMERRAPAGALDWGATFTSRRERGDARGAQALPNQQRAGRPVRQGHGL